MQIRAGLAMCALVAVGACAGDHNEDRGASSGGEALSGSSVCVDADDVGRGDLSRVELSVDPEADQLRVTWQVNQAPLALRRVLYSVSLSDFDADGNGPSYQLGVSTDGRGVGTGSFVSDRASGANVQMDVAPGLEDNSVVGRFDLADIEGLTMRSYWSAAVTVDGEDADQCPALNQPFVS